MIKATDTDIQQNFDYYLRLVESGEKIIILKNGKEIAKLISHKSSVSFMTDSLTGVLKGDYDDKAMYAEKMDKCKNKNT